MRDHEGGCLTSVTSCVTCAIIELMSFCFNCVLHHPSVHHSELLEDPCRVVFTLVPQRLALRRLLNRQLCLLGHVCGETVRSAASPVRPMQDQAKGEATPGREYPKNRSGSYRVGQETDDEEEGCPRRSEV